jgi:hypothetical protein
VRDLTEWLNTQLLLFDNEFFFLDGPSSLSPDGSQVALLVRAAFDQLNAPNNGLWLVDLTSEDAPQQIATVEDFQEPLPGGQIMPAVPQGLVWTLDGSGFVAVATSNDTHAPLVLYYYIDPSSGDMTPIVDFSSIPDLNSLFTTTGDDNIPMRFYSPWTGAIAPFGNALLTYHNLGGVLGVMMAPLPPNGNLPTLIYNSNSTLTSTTSRSSTASTGKVLMSGVVFTIEEE